MTTLQTIEQILLAVGFAVGIIGLISNYLLFNTLQRRYPKYYKQIGQPKAFGRAYFPTTGDYIQSLKGAAFVYSMVFRGIPSDFPTDSRLKRQARFVRYLFTGFVVIFLVAAALFYPAFK